MRIYNGSNKLTDILKIAQDSDMVNWMLKNYSELSSTNDGILFIMHMLKCYFSKLMSIRLNSSNKKIKAGKIDVYVALLDEFIFDKIFVSEQDEEEVENGKPLSTVEIEIYLAICRYFCKNSEMGMVGKFLVDFFFNDVKLYSKKENFRNNRELKLFFMQNLVSAALSYFSPTFLECLAYVLLDNRWYDKAEKNGGRFNEISPLNVVKQVFYETCATLPVGESIYMDLPKYSPNFAFLTLYTITCSYISRITKEKIQDSMFEKHPFIGTDNNFNNANNNCYTTLRSPAPYCIRIIEYWLRNYRIQLTKLKMSPTVCLPTFNGNFVDLFTAHNSIIFNSTLSNMIVLCIVSPLWFRYDVSDEILSSIHFETINCIESIELLNVSNSNTNNNDQPKRNSYHDTNTIRINHKNEIQSISVPPLTGSSIEFSNSKESLNSASPPTPKLEDGEVSSTAYSSCEEGEIDNDVNLDSFLTNQVEDSLNNLANEETGTIIVTDCIDNMKANDTINGVYDKNYSNVDNLLVFYGTYFDKKLKTICNCEFLGVDYQWIHYMDILMQLHEVLGSYPNFSISIQRFCELFSTYLKVKKVFTLKDQFLEKATTLSGMLSFSDNNLNKIMSIIANKY